VRRIRPLAGGGGGWGDLNCEWGLKMVVVGLGRYGRVGWVGMD